MIAAHIAPRSDGRFDVSLGEDGRTYTLAAPGADGTPSDDNEIGVALWPGHVTLFSGGQAYSFAVPDPLGQSADTAGGADSMRAPMPGVVKVARAASGDAVTKGQPLLVLEAMKMEHTIAAPHDGVISEIVSEGTQVTDGMVLVRFTDAGD
jgi:3-methylcrotonyl-CoA carboxylase alpha subunit